MVSPRRGRNVPLGSHAGVGASPVLRAAKPEIPKGRSGSRALHPVVLRPALGCFVDNVDDPLALSAASENDAEAQASESLTLAQRAFREREAQLLADAKGASPIEFFRVLVFATPVQAQAFARAVGEDARQQYMDGRAVCDCLGIAIPRDPFVPRKALLTPNRKLAELAMPLPRERRKDNGQQT